MKLKKALKLAGKQGMVKSHSAGMYKQRRKDLIHWTMTDNETELETKIKFLTQIVNATDWEVDNGESYE